jgi:DNA-binding winged helix-turn-helix (wHTH) protein
MRVILATRPRVFPGAIVLECGARCVAANGVRVQFGWIEFYVAAAIIGRRGAPISMQELIDLVWRGIIVAPALVRSHVFTARRALAHTGIGISNQRYFGYFAEWRAL